MINEKLNNSDNQIVVRSSPISVVLNESGLSSVSFELPSFEELKSIRDLSLSKISFRDTLCSLDDNSRETYEIELEKLEKKHEAFKDSSKYLNHLAILNELKGDLQKATDILMEAANIDDSPYFINRLAEIFMCQERFSDVGNFVKLPKFKKNIKTYILLALSSIKNKDLVKAETFIHEALSIDDLDFELRYLAGSFELIKGNHPKAIRHFKVAIDGIPYGNVPSSLYVNMGLAYILQKNIKKAVECLKVSYSLNPLNKNAVLLYSNMLIESKNYSEAITILRSYLTYDEKECSVWDLIAKTYYLSKDYKKALESLKHQASLEENSAIWNNIAIVYNELKEYRKANQYYALGLKQGLEKSEVPIILIKNYFRFLSSNKFQAELCELLKLLSPFLDEKSESKISNYYEFILSYIEAVSIVGDEYQAIKRSEEIIKSSKIDLVNKMRIITHLTYYYTMIKPEINKAVYYSSISKKYIETVNVDKTFKLMLYNNIIYTYLDSNQISNAESIISKLNPGINKFAYPTATLGLYHIKKGRVDKGKSYYEKAIKLVLSADEKSRLRQKLYFEIGKYYRSIDRYDLARDYFKKVIKIKNGFDSILRLSHIMLNEIKK